jgi:hypothetical protein
MPPAIVANALKRARFLRTSVHVHGATNRVYCLALLLSASLLHGQATFEKATCSSKAQVPGIARNGSVFGLDRKTNQFLLADLLPEYRFNGFKDASTSSAMMSRRYTSGGIGNSTMQESGCPTNPASWPFSLEYRAYIPFDNVTASPSPACITNAGQTTAVYLGDSPDSVNSNSVPVTYRTSIFGIVTPNSPTALSLVTPTTGITYQFAPPSPIDPPFITSGDYVVPQLGTCYRLNAEGQAVFGIDNNEQTPSASAPSTNSVLVNYQGRVGNPLAAAALTIGWNVNTLVVENTSYSSVNVQVSGTVTCFPAHEIIFQGQQIAYYFPPYSNPAYIAGCLAAPPVANLSGPATLPGGLNVPY